jgi:alkylation response protein AidB-like acyl-CoA dehydrogenase/antitoxin component of RelBE/YafQ-DinJ toxin-antitoxin module
MEQRWKVESSPVHQSIWRHGGVEAFDSSDPDVPGSIRAVMERSLAAVRRHKQAGTRYGPDGIIASELVADLADAGYWGLRASPTYGGAGANIGALAQFITEMAVLDPWVAGMMSIHACIGPVGPLEAFGSADQKARLLRPLAAGQRLGAFAVTEPGTSTDWGAIRTVARPEGDWLFVSGEKLFITNAGPGRTIGTLCLINGRHEMLLIELPEREDEHFRTVTYGLKAPAHIKNVGLVFDNLPVPAANVLRPSHGDGRSVAYHALNHGRVAVCANAAAQLRIIAGSLIPWVQQRQTFGAPIGSRELVQRRLGWLAGRIVACDAMTAWAARLLDEGYRGELECVTAKVFGSETAKEACVDVLLKTHGGRAFLDGNPFSDWVFDILAPTVYEGENEVLTLGYFHALAREHGEHYLAPIATVLTDRPHEGALGHRPSASDLLAAGSHAASYAAWLVSEEVRHAIGRFQHRLSADPAQLSGVAHELLAAMALEISAALRHFGAAIAHRQALAFDLARRAQLATVMLVVSRYAARQQDPLVRQAGVCAALDLGTRLTDSRPTGQMYHLVTELGRAVAEGRFAPVQDAERGSVLMAESAAG